MDSQKHTECSVRAEALTIPELEQSKAAVLNKLASVHSLSELHIRHQQVHRVVLQRTQIELQSRRGCPLQVTYLNRTPGLIGHVIGDSVLYHSLFSIAALGDRIEEGTQREGAEARRLAENGGRLSAVWLLGWTNMGRRKEGGRYGNHGFPVAGR
jgi:hypothetical protein